jgi:hypothetical protein
MKIKSFIYTLIFGILLLSLNGCKDDEPTALSIVGTWNVESVVVSPSIYGETDFYKDLDDCQKDNLYEFRNDGTYSITDGGNPCNFLKIENQAHISYFPGSGNYSINSSNGFNTLVLDDVYQESNHYHVLNNNAETAIYFSGPFTLKLENNKMIWIKSVKAGEYNQTTEKTDLKAHIFSITFVKK